MKLTQGAVAAHLDLSVRKLREYYARGEIDKAAPLDEQRWQYIRRLRAVASNRKPVGRLDPAQERAALDRQRRLALELDMKERRKDLLKRDDVVTAWQAELLTVRAKLLSLPTRAAAVLAGVTNPRQVETELRRHCHEILSELAEREPTTGESANEHAR